MKKLLFLIYFFAGFTSTAQNFKVVGYLPYYRFDFVEEIDFSKITHLNLAFLNPDTDGNLSIGDLDIDPTVEYAKSVNSDLKVFISIAGGGLTEEWSQAYEKFLKPEYRSEFVHLLVDYVLEHDLDGMDVDLEWGYVNEYYSPFVLTLADSLKSHGKQMSAALPGTYRYADLSDEALQAFDFINLMSYDLTGPWTPDNPGPHSPREFAVQSVNYWRAQILEDSCITLGVPFYGWDFTDLNSISAFAYAAMVHESKHYAYTDRVGDKYYNGIPTIQYKTLFALEEGIAGIMIWELGQDSFKDNHEFSLLSAIDYVVETGTALITGFERSSLSDFEVYPSPFHERLTIASPINAKGIIVDLFDLQGRVHITQQFKSVANELIMDLSQLPEGVYVMKIDAGPHSYTRKVIKSY